MKPKKPRLEWEVKTLAGRIYVTDEDNYDSSLQMNIDGDEAVIHTLNGRRFFEAIKDSEIRDRMFPAGVKSIRFVMMERTLKYFRAVADDWVNIIDEGTIKKNGRTFLKVRITLKG